MEILTLFAARVQDGARHKAVRIRSLNVSTKAVGILLLGLGQAEEGKIARSHVVALLPRTALHRHHRLAPPWP